MKVLTIKGPLERSELSVADIVSEDEGSNTRTIASEWRTPDGELVKRSVWTEILMPLEMGFGS